MAYTIFALKWRPKNFDEIIGQNHIVATLKSAIQNNRLAHAYLFAGPRGVGKTSTARILAKAINCKNGPTLNPCSTCSTCIEIAQGRSLDVIEIDGASNRGIDEIRVLRENVKFAPVQGKYKIYIIDEVHQITPDGFNALLKTLEEPPEYVKFIFATTHPHKVMPTILSRCQRFDFRRISMMEISAQLERIVKAEGITIDKEVLFAIARNSDGSLRDAESVLDQLFSFSQQKISLKEVVFVLGLVEQDTLFAMADKIIQKDALAALELLNSLIDDGKDVNVFLSSLIEHFRNLMVAKVSKADPKLLDLPLDICDKLLKQSEAFTLDEILNAFNILISTQEMTKRLDSLRIPMEIGLMRLTHNKKVAQATPQEMKAAPIIQEAKVIEKIKDTVNKPEPPVQACHIGLDNIKESWQNIVKNLSAVKMSAATYLNEGEPVKMQGNLITVSFPKNYSLHKESLEGKDNKAIIEKSVSELFQTNLRLNFILSQESKQEDTNQNHPFLRTALDMFGGRIIQGE